MLFSRLVKAVRLNLTVNQVNWLVSCWQNLVIDATVGVCNLTDMSKLYTNRFRLGEYIVNLVVMERRVVAILDVKYLQEYLRKSRHRMYKCSTRGAYA